MNSDLLNISLKQGKKFNVYQKEIKENIHKIEGFVSSRPLEEQEQIVRPDFDGYLPVIKNIKESKKSINSANKNDLDELRELQTKYNKLIKEYTDIQKKISNASLAAINRLSSNNPYLGKNLQFTNGKIVYVTERGIARPYTSVEAFNGTIGKNGCPKEIIKLNIPWTSEYIQGATIPTNPILIVGSNMVMGQSCGNEGINVFASKLVNNPSSTYVGCYNDKPPVINVSVVPVMNSSNKNNGFSSSASSQDPVNRPQNGPWSAFDQNPKTFWHSGGTTNNIYNAVYGVYKGSNGVNIVNVGKINGEFLQINMPGVDTDSVQNITVNRYSLTPRSDTLLNITTRSPNSWYVLGYKDSQWYQVDRQKNQSFTNAIPKVYNVSSPGAYGAYILLIDKVGNDDQGKNRSYVMIAEWNLFMNTNENVSDDKRAMILNSDTLGYTSFDKCQEYAIDNGYKFFGLQDVQSNGTSQCLVSNDISRTTIYDEVTVQTTSIPIWSSNTRGNAFCTVTADGRFIINDPTKLLWQSSDPLPDCLYGGYVNPDSIQGSWGGNCVGKPLNIDCGNPDPNKSYGTDGIVGNLNSILKNQASNNTLLGKTPQINWSFNPMSEFTGGDPAFCCAKLVDYSYQCGGAPFKKGQISGGSNITFDCSAEVSKCSFFLILQNDGDLCLFRGTPSNFIEKVWSSKTAGKQKSANPDWVSSKGKYGRNYLNLNENLSRGEWIGSDNGVIKLIMDIDGNLVLYTSTATSGCKNIDGKTYGLESVNAVYELDSVGNKATLGNIGFVDYESKLKEYPDSMVGFTTNYQIYQNTDSVGNDITSLVASDQNACQTACNKNPDCSAYVYQGSSQTCWLKNKSAFPKGNKQPNNNVVLGVRQPGLNAPKNCSNKIINIDTVQYDNYVKGANMTPNTRCNPPIISDEDKIIYDNVMSQLVTLGNNIVLKMEKLYNQDNKIFKMFNINDEQFKRDLEKYKVTNLKIQQIKKLLQGNNIEGMQNLTNVPNINDLKGMLSDSDLRVLKENYTYIMWSILAVGILTITINTMKK